MTLNLKSREGLDLHSVWSSNADVVVENFRPDVKLASASTTRR